MLHVTLHVHEDLSILSCAYVFASVEQIPPTEVFDILSQHRNKVLKWLRAHESDKSLSSLLQKHRPSSSSISSASAVTTFRSTSGATISEDDILGGNDEPRQLLLSYSVPV